MEKCKLDCPNCNNQLECESCQNGYWFEDGICICEPYERDEYGRVMDEEYYRNLANYGTPESPVHYNKYNGCWEI